MTNIEQWDRPLSDPERSDIVESIAAGFKRLPTEEDDTAKDIIASVDEAIRTIQSRAENYEASWLHQLAYMVGSIWGDQIVKTFAWEWAYIETEESGSFGVVSKDRSLAIYPFGFSEVCFKTPNADVTVELAFNMLQGNSIPNQAPGSYTNIMAHISHVVP